ncbi:hypothetical protein [Mesorhizobium sp. M9A.F.Ca.ET.002.03.1.2]|uniref:hypothetical protein n=1 Tax=Mesorhizobium sp. M9A.F.Ca.ET.002.03.1.2 TaxID=2493668 RepID=UPI0016752ABF|nr:hypothetical protein [Mesorhizobium sp. M9A.F.Ca.ET.002.03.1.2]
MPEHSARHPEFRREVNLVAARGRRHSPAVGALVREATQKRWIGERTTALSAAE